MSAILALVFIVSCLSLLLGMISPSAVLFWKEPQYRSRGTVIKFFLTAAIGSVILGILATPAPSDKQPRPSQNAPTETATPKINLPASEIQFLKIINKYATLYADAENELKKSKLWKERDAAITTIASRGIIDWVGTIVNMGTNSDGKAYISIKISDNVTISTMNNAFSDSLLGSNTLIPQNSPLYDAIAEMQIGDVVKFSATIVEIANLTEAGKMEEPDFVARILKVEKAR